MNDKILKHYGVKGMRWGVRRSRDEARSRKGTVVLKKGTKFQRIATNSNVGYTKGVYVSYKNSDKDLYKGVLGRMRVTALLKEQGDISLKEVTMVTKKDIVIPSKKARVEEFTKLYNENPKEVMKLINEHASSRYKKDISLNYFDPSKKRHTATMYEKFNDALAEGPHSPNGKIIKKYYNNLSKQGYDAVPDENDIRLSTFKAQAPIILLNTNKTVGQIYARELTAGEVYSAYNRSIIKKMVRNALEPGGIGFETLTPDSRKSSKLYAEQLKKDKFALDSKYTMANLAEDWGKNRLSSSQISRVSKKMGEGKTHEEAVAETMAVGNVAADYILNRFNL